MDMNLFFYYLLLLKLYLYFKTNLDRRQMNDETTLRDVLRQRIN